MTVPAVGITPIVAPTLSPGLSTAGTAAPAGGSSFAEGLAQVQQLQDAANTAADGLATGSLTDISQFTTASAKASLGVQLTVALRDRAVEAYQEIMRMQI